jgi:hypothetical protein
MKKKSKSRVRPTAAQKAEIRAAQFATRAFREELAKDKSLSPLRIGQLMSSEEDKARSNPYGSRFYKKIYTSGPMTSKEIKEALK